jgi:hypothetical protein
MLVFTLTCSTLTVARTANAANAIGRSQFALAIAQIPLQNLLADSIQKPLSDSISDSISNSISNSISDSVPTQDTSEFIPDERFRYANQQQYTIDGSPVRRWTELRPVPAIIAGTAVGGLVTGLQIHQGIVFWNERVPFRMLEDWAIDYQADKGGHFFAGYMASRLAKDAMLTAGYGWDMAVICGSLTGLGYQFYVEIMDGYGKNWGFSPTDAVFNALGAGLHLAQHYVPVLQNITPKADLYDPKWYGEKSRKFSLNPLDDYSAWTWWLSINVHNLLPPEAQRWYPDWLNIAVGYAARNIDWDDVDRKFIISLDYNLEKIIPEIADAPLWNWLRSYINIIKLPAPAVEFSATRPPRFYLLYPFKIGATP